ncbi:PIG-L family deacetylase [Methanoplanus sp. FWC-SCC4]|uniref:PIG-L family deacetylase n=1 Tax=Methanochimaera problematica TaxID=2609417 RepID=A0AA97I4H3_9EURY|nr:PIG-L deacetylase family protein [Methanoplanus sp. FWC-SCC4]WOF16351.1 PIG-L family deacetylase [Methanoplanus sp. FWC-SCC4]
MKKILIISPHTDDGELGCGGAIARFVEEGNDVSYVALSSCEKSVPKECPPDILKTEVKRATKVLGIDEPILYGFDVREFPRLRQEILDVLISLKNEIKPDLVFTPSTYDTHQDHKTTREETLRAFKQCTILGYEQPWNNITFNTLAFISLNEEHLEKKIEALKCYETQKDRSYLSDNFIRGLALTRGTQIEEKYAEAFEVIKWVMRLGV